MRTRIMAFLALTIVLLTSSAWTMSPAQAADDSKSAIGTSALTYYSWKDLNSGKCLGVSGGNMTNGTKLVQWTCNGNRDQYWEEFWGAGDFHGLRNLANRNKCAGVPGGSHQQGVQLVIWDCNGNADQLWKPRLVGNHCVAFESKGTPGFYIGVKASALTNGAAVVQWPWLNHADQKWCNPAVP